MAARRSGPGVGPGAELTRIRRPALMMGPPPPPVQIAFNAHPSVAWVDLRIGQDDVARARLEKALAQLPEQLTPGTLARALDGVAPLAVVEALRAAPNLAAFLRLATDRASGLDRLPAIAPVVDARDLSEQPGPGQVARPRPADTHGCDAWTFLAIRSRVRGNAFVKAADPYLIASELGTAAYLRVPSSWKPEARE